MSKTKPLIGISTGDPNGIGIEVILKCYSDKRMYYFGIPIIFSNFNLIQDQLKHLNIDVDLNKIDKIEKANPKKLNVLEITNKTFEINYGKVNKEGGDHSRASLTEASKYLKENKIDVLVTAPINKKNIKNSDFNYMGHTDFLNKTFDGEAMMFMISDDLKVALLTEHIPVSNVVNQISKELLSNKLSVIKKSLTVDFGITSPKIAVLSINPHAGDDGIIGDEDQKFLIPSLKEISNNENLLFGPFPSDSFFGSNQYKLYDAILAIYHDQGLIPFKTISFGNGVNFTAGLDVVRTSPDHGTGYDIAGKNQADPSSFRSAIYSAIKIFKNRISFNNDNSNPLEISDSKSLKK